MLIHHFNSNYRRRKRIAASAPSFEPVETLIDDGVDTMDMGGCKDFEVAPGVILHAGGSEQCLTRRVRAA